MKVTFEFDTDSENFSRQDLEKYYQVDKMLSAISDITDKLRSWYKYDERAAIPTEEVYDSIWDIIQDNGVNLERMGY